MTKEKLHKDLDELQSQLDQTEPKDDASREKMDSLREGIRNAKQQQGPVSAETGQDLRHRLEQSLESFEVSHPNLTGFVNNVITTLNSIGI
jgi:phage shock protein A